GNQVKTQPPVGLTSVTTHPQHPEVDYHIFAIVSIRNTSFDVILCQATTPRSRIFSNKGWIWVRYSTEEDRESQSWWKALAGYSGYWVRKVSAARAASAGRPAIASPAARKSCAHP